MAKTLDMSAAVVTKSKQLNRLKLQPAQIKKLFVEYVEYCISQRRFLNIAGFCVFAGISKNTYYSYAKKDEFKEVYEFMSNVGEDFALNVPSKQYPIAIMYLKNRFGYADKVENKNTDTNIERIINALEEDSEGEMALDL